MKLFKSLLITLMITSGVSLNAQTKEIEDVDFPTSMTINNQQTVLNGGGLREKYGFLDLYVGGLYVKSKTQDADKIVMADEEMGMNYYCFFYGYKGAFYRST